MAEQYHLLNQREFDDAVLEAQGAVIGVTAAHEEGTPALTPAQKAGYDAAFATLFDHGYAAALADMGSNPYPVTVPLRDILRWVAAHAAACLDESMTEDGAEQDQAAIRAKEALRNIRAILLTLTAPPRPSRGCDCPTGISEPVVVIHEPSCDLYPCHCPRKLSRPPQPDHLAQCPGSQGLPGYQQLP